MGLGSRCCLYIPLALAGLVPDGPALFFGGLALAFVYATYFEIKWILFALDGCGSTRGWSFLSDALFFALLARSFLAAGRRAFFARPGLSVLVAFGWRYVSARAPAPKPVKLDRAIARYSGLALVSTYASVMRFPAVVAVAGFMATSDVSPRSHLLSLWFCRSF